MVRDILLETQVICVLINYIYLLMGVERIKNRGKALLLKVRKTIAKNNIIK